jgi:hypothetical protein
MRKGNQNADCAGAGGGVDRVGDFAMREKMGVRPATSSAWMWRLLARTRWGLRDGDGMAREEMAERRARRAGGDGAPPSSGMEILG